MHGEASSSWDGSTLQTAISYAPTSCLRLKDKREAEMERLLSLWDNKWYGPEELGWLKRAQGPPPTPLEDSVKAAANYPSYSNLLALSHARPCTPQASWGLRTPRASSFWMREEEPLQGHITAHAPLFLPPPPHASQPAQQQQQPSSSRQDASQQQLQGSSMTEEDAASTAPSQSLPTNISTPLLSSEAYFAPRAISDGDGASDGGSLTRASICADAPAPAQHPPSWTTRQTRPAYMNGGTGLHMHMHMNPILESGSPNLGQGAIASAATPAGQSAAEVAKRSLQQVVQQQQQRQQQDHAQQQQKRQQQLNAVERRDSLDSDAGETAAWKWRFARRWHLEQTRPAVEDATPDKTEEALAFLHAGGGAGLNLQVDRLNSGASRTTSILQSQSTLPGMGSLLAHEMLLDEDQPSLQGYPDGPGSLACRANRRGWGSETGQATRELNSLNRRAVSLLQQQQQLEAKAEERWQEAMPAEEKWLASNLPAVEIDEWGTFTFLAFRVGVRNGKQHIVIRGRNYCTQGQIVNELTCKVQALASQYGLPVEIAELMGGGVMEWRVERDRHLCIHSGFTSQLPAAGESKASGACKLINLAAVLTKQSLPIHYKVSVDY